MRNGPIAVTHDRAASLERPLPRSRSVPGISCCAGGISVLLGSTSREGGRTFSLPPSAAWSAAGGAPSSLLWDCSAGASDLPRRAPQDLPSPGSPATAAPSRPATHAQIHRGMTNVIDLDEPHLRRDGMIPHRKCVGKASIRPRSAARRARCNSLCKSHLVGQSNVPSRLGSHVCKHLILGTFFPGPPGVVPPGTWGIPLETTLGPPRRGPHKMLPTRL
jgi:hypothetical protein